jgi:signal peptidase II
VKQRLPGQFDRGMVLYAAIALSGCALDLATKRWVFAWLAGPLGHRFHVKWNLFLETSLNEGALFGFGQGRSLTFACLSVAALAGILYWLLFAKGTRDRPLTVALALITAGILGNLYDRLGLPGLQWQDFPGLNRTGPIYAVRDWILVFIGHWPWPTFNLADSMLVCGAILLSWHAFRPPTASHSQ